MTYNIFKNEEFVKEPEEVPVKINLNIDVDYTTLESFNKVLNTGSNIKICNQIIQNFNMLLDYDNMNNPVTRELYTTIWTNQKFLQCFKIVLEQNANRLENIMGGVRRFVICRICYNFMKNNKSFDITILRSIVDMVNRPFIIPLMSIMDKNSAGFIALSRFSSSDDKVAVIRLITAIVKIGYKFSVNDIIYILGKFYSRNFSLVFMYTMTTMIKTENDVEKYNDDNLSFAIMYILEENMTSNDILATLSKYSMYLKFNPEIETRFNIAAISPVDYKRIINVINQMDEYFR